MLNPTIRDLMDQLSKFRNEHAAVTHNATFMEAQVDRLTKELVSLKSENARLRNLVKEKEAQGVLNKEMEKNPKTNTKRG